MKLTLIRHGMTRGNMLHIYYGSTDLPIFPESYTELEARAKTGFYPTRRTLLHQRNAARRAEFSRNLRGHSA